jgi:hypothetical protein
MTLINGIEIDNIRYIHNPMKEAIFWNEPIDNVLHVITVISNPCQFASRYLLAKEFMYRMQSEPNVKLYVVELAYDKQEFHLTKKENPQHLQIRGNTPLWHKENMINIATKHLLPPNWKAMAWIDADVEFESTSWALDALKVLNGSKDVIQLFSHCLDMDKKEKTMQTFASFGYQYCKQTSNYKSNGNDLWHPGYAWAITKRAYERMGGLYDLSILGSGDHNMALCFLGHGLQSVNGQTSDGYKKSIRVFEEKSRNIRIGYVPGVIRHYFHGSKQNRKYTERWKILVDHQYDPYVHIKHDTTGLILPTCDCPPQLLTDILSYFHERNEDE